MTSKILSAETQKRMRVCAFIVCTAVCVCFSAGASPRPTKMGAPFFCKSNIGEQAGSRWPLTAMRELIYCQRTSYANFCPKLRNEAETPHYIFITPFLKVLRGLGAYLRSKSRVFALVPSITFFKSSPRTASPRPIKIPCGRIACRGYGGRARGQRVCRGGRR